jgi:hypothetical protein
MAIMMDEKYGSRNELERKKISKTQMAESRIKARGRVR